MKKLILLSAIIFGLMFVSCSKSDDDVKTDVVELVGEWRVTNLDFTVMTEGGRPASDACIQELVTGYEFHADSTFSFILGEINSPINFEGEYWTWEGSTDGFKIIQNNPMSPPYNFSLTPTDIQIDNTGAKPVMTFHTEMSNGSSAKITLVKEPIDKTKFPVVTDPDGNPYHCGFFD